MRNIAPNLNQGKKENIAILIISQDCAMQVKKNLEEACSKSKKVYFCDNASEDDSLEIAQGYRKFRGACNLYIIANETREEYQRLLKRLLEKATSDGFKSHIIINLIKEQC